MVRRIPPPRPTGRRLRRDGSTPESVSAEAARRLFLGAQGLLDDPSRPTGPEDLQELIVRLGFVQVDTIQTVARAHDLILQARRDHYRPDHLRELLEVRRSLFEGFTHDASVIPTSWYPHWRPRWRKDRPRLESHPWWRKLLGPQARSICRHILRRIRAEGPLGSVDFQRTAARGPWWDWKPEKAALDYLWRTGRLAIAGRVHFHKRYDLPERVYPAAEACPAPSAAAHRDWACATAAERLVIFTPRELAAFWAALDLDQARAWCQAALRQGRLREVSVQSVGEEPAQAALALSDWAERLAALPSAPARQRLLCPFDPVLRDRARAARRFGFHHRFEGFVPSGQRQHGYYVMPILEGERLVGRCDPKFDREAGRLLIRNILWEPGVDDTRARRRALEEAAARLAEFVGAERWELA